MAVGKMMAGQKGKGPNPRHQQTMNKYGTAKDMSQPGGAGGLLSMMNQMQAPGRQTPMQQAPDVSRGSDMGSIVGLLNATAAPQQSKQGQSPQIDEYIRSLLG